MKKKLEIKNVLIDETKYKNAERVLSSALDKIKKLIGIENLMLL